MIRFAASFIRNHGTGPDTGEVVRSLPRIRAAGNGRRMRRFTSLIVDASGRRVRSVWQGALTGRTTTLQWDGRDDSGREVPAGVYLARLQGAAESVVARLVRTE